MSWVRRWLRHPDAWLYAIILILAIVTLILLMRLLNNQSIVGADVPNPPAVARANASVVEAIAQATSTATETPSQSPSTTPNTTPTASHTPTDPPPTPTPELTWTPVITPTNTLTALVTEPIASTATEAPATSEATSEATTAPPADAGSAQVYTIVRGDNLYRIAQRYGVTVEALAVTNNIGADYRIFVGQALTIPDGGVMPPPSPTAAPVVSVPQAAPPVTAVAAAAESASLSLIVPPAPDLSLLPSSLNELPINQLIVMSPEVVANIRQIYAYGQSLGRNPRAFSKVGDSTIEPPFFMARFDGGPYNLAEFAYLELVIQYYAGSFARQSAAVKRGMHTWSALDPMWAGAGCLSGENVIQCEIRQHNPSMMIIRMGSNDAGIPDTTERNLRRIVEICLENGVIPIMGTKADRFEGPGNINNNIIRRVAADYQVPLWDFDLIAQTVPGRGLGSDGVHMTAFYAHDWSLSEAWTRGHAVHNLTALMMLYAVWLQLEGA